MGLKKIVDLDRLSRFKDKILALIPVLDGTLSKSGQAADAKATGDALEEKQLKPYMFRVFHDASADPEYEVTTAPETIGEIIQLIYGGKNVSLEISNIDLTEATYYNGEIYPLGSGSVGILFKRMEPAINIATITMTGANANAVGLVGSYSDSGNIDSEITWAFYDLGTMPLATQAEIPTNVSDLTNDSGFITGYTETDPTVPAWAKTATKPIYTAAEVGSGFAFCTTEAETLAKTVEISGYKESSGGHFTVKFLRDVPAGATLKINNEEAMRIVYKAATIPSGFIKAGDTVTFINAVSTYNIINIDRWKGEPPFIVNFEYVSREDDGTIYMSSSATPTEIYNAYTSNRYVIGYYDDEERLFQLCSHGYNVESIYFSSLLDGIEETIYSESYDDDTSWILYSIDLNNPYLRQGHADDGKIQVASNGRWTAAQPTIPMGHLDSGSTATVMTATIPGITELRDGVCVWLRNGVIASASGVTLNINGLGAKPIYNSLAGTAVTTTFTKVATHLFVYNSTRVSGGCWDMVYGYDANTTYAPVKLGFGYGTCTTAEATLAKTASISNYTLTTGGIVAIKFENDVPANATLNITSKGAKAIYYKGAAITDGVIKAGDTVTMIYSTYYHVLSIDRDVDTIPPSPSNDTPIDVGNASYAGVSSDYARADHCHALDSVALENAISDLYAINIPVIMYNSSTNGVYVRKNPQNLASAYQSQIKINFALVVPPDYNNYPVLFTPSKFDATTGELHLTGIVGGVLYEATLLPGADPTGQSSNPIMVGTMTTTNLVLPGAQGVSF